MSKHKTKDSFWLSYSDLMTSLFFVMLVLFVLAISLQHGVVVATKGQLQKIHDLEKSIENIDSKYFVYDDEYKRHTLKDINVSFRVNSSDIRDISISDRKKLLNAGKAIQEFLRRAQVVVADAEYLIIIEGQSSKDNYTRNYELSYERALALVNYWKNNGIKFDNLPCELIISGSGQNSKFRNKPDVGSNASNQRFVIHIIPKPGIIEHLDKYE